MTGLERLQKTLEAGECAIFFSKVTRQYLAGFRSSDGVLLVTADAAKLYLDSRYFEMACLKQRAGEISGALEILPARFPRELSRFSEEGKIKKAFFEETRLTVSQLNHLEKTYRQIRFLPLGGRVDEMRAVKTEEEIRRVAQAQKLAEEAYLYILPRLEEGRTELSVAAELEYYMKLHGASEPSFGTICVSGTRSSLPHGTPTENPLEKNAFVTMDFGCVLDGFSSDMTRTVCIGKASDEMRLVYDTVLKAQEAALSAVHAGVRGKDVDAAARDLIAAAGFGENFGHSTGHGIGLEVHEAPNFSPRSEGIIPAGAILSVEPGIYLPGKFGVRIEDLVVVREDLGENLNATSKELLEL